jgi:hypothetical protein
MTQFSMLILTSVMTVLSAQASDIDVAELIANGKPFVFEQGGNQCDKMFLYSSYENEITEKNIGTYLGAQNSGCRTPDERIYDCAGGSVLNGCTWKSDGAYGNSTYTETHVIKLHQDSLTIEMLIHNTHCDASYSQNGYCPDKSGEQVFDRFVSAN